MAKKTTRRKQVIPADESNAGRFVRVVKPRVDKAIKAISLIGYCAGVGYEYTPEQVQQIHNALSAALENLCDKFEAKPSAQAGFTFGK